jgi:serine/threonine-protein kinase
MPTPEQTGDRYQLQGEIARGGMGAVLRGRDVDLGRDMAIKVLLKKHAHRPEVLRRFIEEAQIGGQLQHPGVVPVYDIGRFGDRPFFTMKLVKGHTLAALLGERAEPGADRLRFLAIALQVVQTLAYAHAKGVIHRDLKPANIMVGAFGEVQVMDWGLAKVLHEGGFTDEERASRQHQPEDGTQIRTARSSGSTGKFGMDTEAGSLLGTPAYMPPEQANGDIANLDRRADVFGLGAILCEILTGKPPYVGRSAEEVRRKAANGDLADALAHLDYCGADAELIVLTRACLSAEAIDRPRDAQAVAEGLTAYLDGVQERLRQAELAEAQARSKAIEEAKRRRLTLALAATVLLALTLGGGAWLWVKNERDARQAQVTRDVNQALNQATALREQARTANLGRALLFAQAREQAQRALALVENSPADDTLKTQVRQLQTELDEEEKDRQLVTALDEARLEQAKTLAGENRFASERAVPKFRAAFAAYGLAVGEGDLAAAAQRVRKRPAGVREMIVAALDEWDDLAGRPILRITEPHRDWLRAVLEAAEADDWGRQLRAARRETDPAKRQAALEALAKSAKVEELPAQALTRLAGQLRPAQAMELLRRAQQQYPADFWVNHNLGMVLRNVTPPEREDAVRYLTAAVALRPESPGCLMNLGLALRDKGQGDEAIACYLKVITLDPKYAEAHTNLGNALADKGKVDKAIASHRKAIALDPMLAGAYTNLGIVLRAKGQVEEAIASYRKAIDLDPKDALAHSNLGIALKGKGQLDAAIANYRKAIELDPKFSKAHTNLGNALADKGKVEEAIACHRKAIALDPKNASAHYNLGRVLRDKGEVEEAIACFHKAIELDLKHAKAHDNLGTALYGKGQFDEAIASYKKAIELQPQYAAAHRNLGFALKAKGLVDEAIASYHKAIEFDPNDARAHDGLGAILCEGKQEYDAAITCFRKAIELDPRFAIPHYNLGKALQGKDQVDTAIASYRKAIELDPKLVRAHTNLGAIFCDRKKNYDAAIACFRKAIAFDPKDATLHCNLGKALHGNGQVDEAMACFRNAIELDPKLALAQFNLGLALQAKGQLEEAMTCYHKAIALDPKHAKAHYNLGNALSRKGKVEEAIARYRKAIALDPKHAEAHCNLGHSLRIKGRFAEALAALQRGHELGTQRPGWRYPSAAWVRQATWLAALEARLPAFLKGEFQPQNATQHLGLGGVCQAKKLHAAAARLYADAFAADPRLADDPKAGHRYNAACSAALAAAGQGKEAAKVDDAAKAKLRGQALDWLKADLTLRTKQLKTGKPADRAAVQEALRYWQKDTDLASIRDAAALAKLPAEERKACEKLWADVAALLNKAQTPTRKEGKR